MSCVVRWWGVLFVKGMHVYLICVGSFELNEKIFASDKSIPFLDKFQDDFSIKLVEYFTVKC